MDDVAMTDLPMRLLISAVLTSLIVPIVIGGYQDLSCSVAEDRALKEMSRIARSARSVMDGDIGSSLVIQLELEGFGGAGFVKGIIGGPLHGESAYASMMIVFQLNTLGRMTSAPDPPVRMTGPDGTAGLDLAPGKVELVVTHILVEGVHAASFSRS